MAYFLTPMFSGFSRVSSMASKRIGCLLQVYNNSLKTNATVNALARAYASLQYEDTETHTGQKFEKDDRRLARFVDRNVKEVNENWAIKLIAEVPPAPSKDRIVSCDGGGGPLGHPKVYINLDKPGNHSCGYCGLRFYKEDKH